MPHDWMDTLRFAVLTFALFVAIGLPAAALILKDWNKK